MHRCCQKKQTPVVLRELKVKFKGEVKHTQSEQGCVQRPEGELVAEVGLAMSEGVRHGGGTQEGRNTDFGQNLKSLEYLTLHFILHM